MGGDKKHKKCDCVKCIKIMDDISINCDGKMVSVKQPICDLLESNKWLSVLPCYSWGIQSNDTPFPIASWGAGNVYKLDPESTLPASMWDSVNGIFTAPVSGLYSLDMTHSWYCGGSSESGYVFSDWTCEGNYTSRWNIEGPTGCVDICCPSSKRGTTVYASSLAGDIPRNNDTGKILSENNTIVKLQAGQTFKPEAFASYTLSPPIGSTGPAGAFLFLNSQFTIYLLTPISSSSSVSPSKEVVLDSRVLSGFIGSL